MPDNVISPLIDVFKLEKLTLGAPKYARRAFNGHIEKMQTSKLTI